MAALRAFLLLLSLALCPSLAWSGPAEDPALLRAAGTLDIDGVRTALERGANPNTTTTDKVPQTPLNSAARSVFIPDMPDADSRAVSIASLLFERGARLGKADRDILYFPIAGGANSLIELLVSHGASVTERLENRTPPELALLKNRQSTYELLIKLGARPVAPQDSSQLRLIGAVLEIPFIPEAAARVIEDGAMLDLPDPSGETALIAAIEVPIYASDAGKNVDWLLANGADPNATASTLYKGEQQLPLHLFIQANACSMNPNNTCEFGSFGDMARQMAQLRGEPISDIQKRANELLWKIIKAGAKLESKNPQGGTAMHIAAITDNVGAAKILIQAGGHVAVADKANKRPVDYAKSPEMKKLLTDNSTP